MFAFYNYYIPQFTKMNDISAVSSRLTIELGSMMYSWLYACVVLSVVPQTAGIVCACR